MRLSARELAAWRGFLRTHSRLLAALDERLEREHDLSIAEYDVLVQLEGAPGHALRMSELADAVLLSPSGLTRLVDRLERRALLVRRHCPSDGRGLLAVLTEDGGRRLKQARPDHLRAVRELFLEPLAASEVDALGSAWNRIGG